MLRGYEEPESPNKHASSLFMQIDVVGEQKCSNFRLRPFYFFVLLSHLYHHLLMVGLNYAESCEYLNLDDENSSIQMIMNSCN